MCYSTKYQLGDYFKISRLCILTTLILVGFSRMLYALDEQRDGEASQILRTGVVVEADRTGFIQGRVLNGNHTAISVLPMTMNCVRTNGGQFKILWTQRWYAEGGTVQIMATDFEMNRAAIVSVEDANDEIDVVLEPAHQISGKLVDFEGNGVSDTLVAVSLVSTFKYDVPVGCVRTNSTGTFTLRLLPTNQTYRLHLMQPDSQKYHLSLASDWNREVVLEIKDADNAAIDLGSVWILPKEASQDANDDATENWTKIFDKTYCLETGENIKFIKAPYILERQEYFFNRTVNRGCRTQPEDGIKMLRGFSLVSMWHWYDGQLRDDILGAKWSSSGVTLRSLKSVVKRVLNIEGYDLEMLDGLYWPQGEWIVRENISEEEKLRAYEDIILSELNLKFHFEKQGDF